MILKFIFQIEFNRVVPEFQNAEFQQAFSTRILWRLKMIPVIFHFDSDALNRF